MLAIIIICCEGLSDEVTYRLGSRTLFGLAAHEPADISASALAEQPMWLQLHRAAVGVHLRLCVSYRCFKVDS